METEYREQFIKFGLKVQYYRKLRNMTQEAFADEIGKSWSFVAKIESPTRAFGVSMETLFKIAEGRTDPILAVTLGRLKVEGNIDKALKLKDLINSKKKKGKKSK